MRLEEALKDGALDPANIGTLRFSPQVWWRVHPGRYAAIGFNDTLYGGARFSPLQIGREIVPTLYAGTTPAAALMETVLHDLPTPSAGFAVTLSATTDKRMASFRPSADLLLGDLSSLGLRRLGLTRTDVIDCDNAGYPLTRRFAQWIYEHKADVHGLAWTSRQHDGERAIVLFEPRLAGVELQVQAQDESIVDGAHFATLLALLDQLGAGLQMDP